MPWLRLELPQDFLLGALIGLPLIAVALLLEMKRRRRAERG